MPENQTRICSQCGAPLDLNAATCKYCGDAIVAPQTTEEPIADEEAEVKEEPQEEIDWESALAVSGKNKIVAGVLAIFLGCIGIHKFYLGRIGMGILYFLFCWTYVPLVLGFFEGLIYLTSTNQVFYMKYVKKKF